MRDYSFGNFLHELRERCGLSQYQLGALVGVSNKAVSKWENGSAKPQSRILYKLSDVLGVTVDELLACKYRSPESGNTKGVFAMKKKLWKNVQQALQNLYGDMPPIEVHNRCLSECAELQYSDMIVYLDMLGKISNLANDRGEHIQVKGITGASFIAYLIGATEINPLKPHYYCPHCRKIEFSDQASDGWDLPEKQCSCGTPFLRDGHNLAFETLRFSIHQNVHLDLSVSHGFYPTVKETIRTYFDGNTAVSLVKQDQPNFERIVILRDKLSDIANGQTLPFEEYYDKLKQYPAVTLTVSEEPDAYRKLEEKTKTSFADVPFATKEVLEAFIQSDKQGIPEFRTQFFKDMANEAHPKTFHDIIQLAGLSHGTGVWTDNAQRLIQSGVPVGKVIAYRDDVFHYIQEKMQAKNISGTGYAYQIMYSTFRGAFAKDGMSGKMKQQLSALGMEEWFAESLEKIRYVFPKAHGVLYVKYALILMWYKVYYPKEFAVCMQTI